MMEPARVEDRNLWVAECLAAEKEARSLRRKLRKAEAWVKRLEKYAHGLEDQIEILRMHQEEPRQ